MGKRQKNRIRNWLIQRRGDLLRRRHASLLLERALQVREVGDEVDASVNAQERSLVERLKEFEYDELRIVQRALVRLENGDYGRCEACGQTIGTARLLAYPETSLCLDCAAEHRRRAQLSVVH